MGAGPILNGQTFFIFFFLPLSFFFLFSAGAFHSNSLSLWAVSLSLVRIRGWMEWGGIQIVITLEYWIVV